MACGSWRRASWRPFGSRREPWLVGVVVFRRASEIELTLSRLEVCGVLTSVTCLHVHAHVHVQQSPLSKKMQNTRSFCPRSCSATPTQARARQGTACTATPAAPPSARATSRRSSASTTSCRGQRHSRPECASTRHMRSSWQAGCLHAASLLQLAADPADRGSYREGWAGLGRIARPAPSSTRPRCRGNCTNATAGH